MFELVVFIMLAPAAVKLGRGLGDLVSRAFTRLWGP